MLKESCYSSTLRFYLVEVVGLLLEQSVKLSDGV